MSAIAVDAAGDTYVTGSRAIATPVGNWPITDVFVTKLDLAGNPTLLATFSGKGTDQGNGIALDPAGNIYIVGNTTSPDFPLRNPIQSASNPRGTGFLVKMTPDGSVLYSTYLGGTLAFSALHSVATDASGNAYVTGQTYASDYQHTAGLPADGVFFYGAGGPISGDFFAKVSAGGTLVYAGVLASGEHDCGGGSTCFLGPVSNSGSAIAVDTSGNAYLAGFAGGMDLPASPGALLARGLGAFVARINAAGTGLDYLTYLATANFIPGVAPSSNPGTLLNAIAVDGQGNAYITGATSDPQFPVTPSAFQTSLGSPLGPGYPLQEPGSNAFVSKLNPTGTAMIWSTYLGGTGSDTGYAMAPDAAGNVWVSGTTQSPNFPKASGFPGGTEFLAELDATGSSLLYSSLSPADTVAQALAVDSGGTVHFAGATGGVSAFSPGSAPGQTAAPWLFGIANSAGGALAGRIAPGELFSIYGLNFGPATPLTATFDAAGFLPTTLGGVQVNVNGIRAPLLYVSATQINAVAPVELTPEAVTLALSAAPDFRTMVVPADPQVFGVAINQDGTLNSQTNPAKPGSIVSVWATGSGYFPGNDGQSATAADEFCQSEGYCAVFDDSGVQLATPYIGAAPDVVNGVIQINFQVSASQSYYLEVIPGGTASPVYSGYFGVYVSP
ncbi:MAG TPA: SBBP repeat-containing protein [Bryobacteraceae bacterium]|nr:SBBP repeat-containing protein [Bryobacteraceae bacterium]